MTVYLAFGTASVGKALFLALFEHAHAVDLVGHSRNEEEAIAEIQRHKPELVIVEEILTHGWGMDIVQSLGAKDTVPAVIMISTMPPPRIPQEYRSQAIDLWLQLPQGLDELRSSLEQLTRNDPHTAITAWRQQLERE